MEREFQKIRRNELGVIFKIITIYYSKLENKLNKRLDLIGKDMRFF